MPSVDGGMLGRLRQSGLLQFVNRLAALEILDMSVDKGQMEAGRSLGLGYTDTMLQIIMPQAIKNCLPALVNEMITLLKETSICGYIGLNELTRGGDIIRGITYDAMMPLLIVAVIYLVIVMFFTWLMGKLERRLRESDIR